MIYTVYKGDRVLHRIQAESLEEAEKISNEKFPKWTEIYIGKKEDYEPWNKKRKVCGRDNQSLYPNKEGDGGVQEGDSKEVV
jgi:hypothetical protein